MYRLFFGIAFGLLLFNGTAMAACSVPYTFTSGTTADASQVNGNFTSLTGCAAPLASPNFTGAVGIGMTASNVLDISQTSSTAAVASILNTGTGNAEARWRASNGTYNSIFSQLGTGYTTSGVFRQNGLLIHTDGPGGLTIDSTGSAPIYFALNNSEVARITTSSTSFLVGKTANGIANAGLQVNYATGQTDITVAGSESMNIIRLSSTGNLVRFFANDASTIIGSISNNSNTSTGFNTTSDERLKAWQIPQHNYRPVIERIWVGDFRWKKSGAPDFGYRAQQTYSLFPAAVHKPSDAKSTWEMDYGKTAALAIWGVKDLYRTTDDQSRSVWALQMEVKRLRVQTIALQQMHANDAAKLERLEHLVMFMKRAPVVQAALK